MSEFGVKKKFGVKKEERGEKEKKEGSVLSWPGLRHCSGFILLHSWSTNTDVEHKEAERGLKII